MAPASRTLHAKLFSSEPERSATRDGFGVGLVEAGGKDNQIVALTGDLAESTRAHLFQEAFPDRFIECGVAEQNMMGVAAGLALSGKIPFVASYAAFSPGRNWDQLRVSVCYSNANVKIAGHHTGLSVGPDGATHQALEDIAVTRVLPNLTVIVPCDAEEARKATLASAKMVGPVYLRLSREKIPTMTTAKTPFKIGRAEILHPGKDVTIVACGPLVYQALVAARELKQQGILAEVINCHTIKPLDIKTIVASVKKTGRCVTAEEHQIIGGLYGAVAEVLGRYLPRPLSPVGMKDSFGESGEPSELWEKYGMTAKDIIRAIKDIKTKKAGS